MPSPRVGVVLDLDGQVAADRFDKDQVLNRNVRMGAVMMLVTRGSQSSETRAAADRGLHVRCDCPSTRSNRGSLAI